MRKVIPFLVFAVVAAVMVWQQLTPETVLMPAPEIVYPEIPGMRWESLEMSDAERETLPKDTVIVRRRYTGTDGHWYQVSAVVGGRSKSSVHRPELCLPGQGFQMSDPRTVLVGGTNWRRLTLMKGGTPPSSFAYTFTNGTGFKTSSHLVRILTDVWDRSILGRIDRWVMLTVVSSRSDEAGFSRFLEQMEGVVK